MEYQQLVRMEALLKTLDQEVEAVQWLVAMVEKKLSPPATVPELDPEEVLPSIY
jgi:hypothetical protein